MTQSTMSSTLNQALAASAEGDSALALELFALAAEAEPESAMPYFLMGSEYAALGQVELAEARFASAVLLAPDFVIARYQLGLLQYTSGRPTIAMLTWQPLLGLQEGPYSHWVRGFAALAQDQFKAATQFFEEGLSLNLEHPPMSQDIRQVMQGIEQIQAESLGSSVDSIQAKDDREEAESSHFLLSNYQQQGPSH